MAGDDPVGWDVHLFHSEIRASVTYEHVDFPKAAGIEEKIKSLTGRQLSLTPVTCHGLFPTHLAQPFFPHFQIINFISTACHGLFPFVRAEPAGTIPAERGSPHLSLDFQSSHRIK
jgi:hypothetical protein